VRDPVVATQGLITRVLGAPFLAQVTLQAIPSDPSAPGNSVFELDAGADGKLVIRGNTGVAMSMGLGYWLKYSTNSSWGWGRNGTGNNIRIPDPLPLPAAKQRVVAPVEKSYYMNVCTLGYCAWGDAGWG
jgi:alpha-N-acetylglucosaminidase